MSNRLQPIVFGEVLFDCFPDGQQILGGAPFNVAWHLQAFGDRPYLISRVGEDSPGRKILQAIEEWGMDISCIQTDSQHQTGRVDITLIDDEPHYTITPNCAYDFIDFENINIPINHGILYHGTLALRNANSRQSYERLANLPGISTFLDVNLRAPWWQKDKVCDWLQRARWVKLNLDELLQLSDISGDIEQQMTWLQKKYELELLIVTRGEEGAIVRSHEGALYMSTPPEIPQFVDTVGAGDAFTAVFLHGLILQTSLIDTLNAAQKFASRVVGLRGAISHDPDFYQPFRAE